MVIGIIGVFGFLLFIAATIVALVRHQPVKRFCVGIALSICLVIVGVAIDTQGKNVAPSNNARFLELDEIQMTNEHYNAIVNYTNKYLQQSGYAAYNPTVEWIGYSKYTGQMTESEYVELQVGGYYSYSANLPTGELITGAVYTYWDENPTILYLTINSTGGDTSLIEYSDTIMLDCWEKYAERAKKPEQVEKEIDVDTTAPDVSPALSIGDTVNIDAFQVTITNFEIVSRIDGEYGYFTPDSGNQYGIVYIDVVNNDTVAKTFWPSFNMGNDVHGNIVYDENYSYSSTQLIGYDTDLHDKHLNPLASASGVIVFSLPDTVVNSDGGLELVLSGGDQQFTYKLR